MKKSLLALTIVFSMIAVMLIGCGFDLGDGNAATAFSVVTIDVNPSIKLCFSKAEKLISIEAENADGQRIADALNAEIKDAPLEEAVEILLDRLFSEGYLGEYSNSVLVSVEKGDGNIEIKITDEIQKCFNKHDKEACIVTQRLEGLGKLDREKIEEIAEKYDISMGKARMIERIRREFPELSEAELANLKMNELALMLEGVSDSIIGHFNKHGSADSGKYISRERAFEIALDDAALDAEALTFSRTHMSREDGKMVYEVEFVSGALEYEYEIDAIDGSIVEKEIEEYEAPDIDKEFGCFMDRYGELLEDYFENGKFDREAFLEDFHKGHGFGSHGGNGNCDAPHHKFDAEDLLDNSMILEEVIKTLGIEGKNIDDVNIRLFSSEEAKLFSLCIELENDDVYKIVAEAHTGIIISAELNGTAVDLTPENTVE